MNTNLNEFEKKIGFIFKNKDLLKQAFIHRSYINENPRNKIGHNERLEFLGDAVLELSVTDFLYKKYPDEQEGKLTAHRAALVNAVTLSEIAVELGMNEYMMLSKGEAKDKGKARQTILADALEALLGAIYEEFGYTGAEKFVKKYILSKTEEVLKRGLLKDAKSKLQEKAQEIYSVTPTYNVLKETGPDHDKHFIIAVCFKDEQIAKGEGKSKQEAQQDAAVKAIGKLGW
jgi:ribonuclease III